ncbi:RNA polymerase sigma factor [Demequina sp. SYSU T00192]|uniref:RNA polymerase sigma factor n=1 Tax=Demequina litoralis TaxID=3051660 RepID=A0ABT8GCB0_9MICO|nr:RNA polymerase sigma factor [Demequina sp. SYSU T00192]MDN4476768.1 RNA polymerase sigma factor [Demequina sp. SYSU T00192]
MTLGPAFESILSAARVGEDWAWAEIYRDLAGPVRGYLAGKGSPSPEDEAADTFLNVARGIASFTGGEGDFRSWVFSIAHRRMVDAHRRSGRRPEAPVADETLALLVREAAPSAEQHALLRGQAETVDRLLCRLNARQREVLLLRVVAGLSVKETAEVVGASESAVKVAQHRAVAALRRDLDRGILDPV